MSLILSLDPSSTKTGVCVMDYQERIHFAALLTASRGVTAPPERIREMGRDLAVLLARYQPSAVAIEWPSGHAHRRHQGGGAGLAVYGAAVGALWMRATLWAETVKPAPLVAPVLETEWTGGRGKGTRTAIVAGLYPSTYQPADDPGGDIADAIGLALWFTRTHRMATA